VGDDRWPHPSETASGRDARRGPAGPLALAGLGCYGEERRWAALAVEEGDGLPLRCWAETGGFRGGCFLFF
jgi:hypothetical protein